ncbi:MAG TPA: hypothetical protein VEP67_03580 [Thiobacillaceae bacterium]|nr:hypothetical protein [Thiobacillaceae bacterium]
MFLLISGEKSVRSLTRRILRIVGRVLLRVCVQDAALLPLPGTGKTDYATLRQWAEAA